MTANFGLQGQMTNLTSEFDNSLVTSVHIPNITVDPFVGHEGIVDTNMRNSFKVCTKEMTARDSLHMIDGDKLHDVSHNYAEESSFV